MGQESIFLNLFSLIGKLSMIALPIIVIIYLWVIFKRRNQTQFTQDARARMFMTQLMTESTAAKTTEASEVETQAQPQIAPVSKPPKAVPLTEADNTSSASVGEREIDLSALASQMSQGRQESETPKLVLFFILAVSVIMFIASTAYYLSLVAPVKKKPVAYSIFVKIIKAQAVSRVEIDGERIVYFMKNGDSNSTRAPVATARSLLEEHAVPYKFVITDDGNKFTGYPLLLLLLVIILIPSNVFLLSYTAHLKRQIRELDN
jgi:FtsH Extracellular